MNRPNARKPRQLPEHRTARLEVRLTPSERAEIAARARAAALPLSDYIRASALHASVRSVYDLDAVNTMAALNGNLGRVGGLLKLWLAERRGDGAAAVKVDDVLASLMEIKDQLADLMQRA